jgi:hypothetical protein
LTRIFKKNTVEFVALAVIIGSFVAIASQRLATVPVPETDESYTLQVAYEMLNRGELSLPMHRYLGGNIENAWHSYTPVYFVILSGFLKATGWGVLQGRIFNLITAVLLLMPFMWWGDGCLTDEWVSQQFCFSRPIKSFSSEAGCCETTLRRRLLRCSLTTCTNAHAQSAVPDGISLQGWPQGPE